MAIVEFPYSFMPNYKRGGQIANFWKKALKFI